MTSALNVGIKGTCAFALREVTRPDIKITKSALLGSVLRLGDVDARPDEAVEIHVKISKATALSRPKSWKKFGRAEGDEVDEDVKMEDEDAGVRWGQLQMRTEYYLDHREVKEEETDEEEEGEEKEKHREKVEKEELVRGFKYGSSYAPCPEGQFPKLETRKGIDICGFFPSKNASIRLLFSQRSLTFRVQFRREHAMGEVSYIWADPSSAQQQIALSSIVQGMYEKGVMAIARWVSRDGADPKMGVLSPNMASDADSLLWVAVRVVDIAKLCDADT